MSAFAYAYIQRMRGKADMRKIHESDISLTPTQERLLGYIAAQTTISGAAQATKKELSQLMGCSVKTIDRAITRMSREGLIKVEPCHSENGGQLVTATDNAVDEPITVAFGTGDLHRCASMPMQSKGWGDCEKEQSG